MTKLAELKVVEYVLRHTWGYQEYDISKRISIDEFMHGRRRTDGSRIDQGTGLSNRSVIDGLRQAVEHGYLVQERDDRDKGRIVKYYRLHIEETCARYEESSYPCEESS
jgi:DNA-binding PadR family transcriptional regulator